MIVVDASALSEVLLGTFAGRSIEKRLFSSRPSLHAPQLLDIEIAHVLRRYALAGMIDNELSNAALNDLADFPIHRYDHQILLRRIWELRHNFTAYDAAYIALTEKLDATLVTRDRRLATAAKRFATVQLI